MILISHRGNTNGIKANLENSPRYIDSALDLGFYVEIDLWKIGEDLFLGHDKPLHKISSNYLDNNKLYVHCKNNKALEFLNSNALACQYFWHQSDNFTLTSNKKIWVHVGEPLIENCICCLPEQYKSNLDLTGCYGICSDFIIKYLDLPASI